MTRSPKLRFVLPFAFFALALVALPAFAGDGKVYGEGLSGDETVALSKIMADPEAYVGQRVRVEGLVVDVCKKRGCWMQIAGDEEFQSIRVKVDDGVIVFPLEAKGHRATAEGIFTKIELTPEQVAARAAHAAKEHGEDHSDCQGEHAHGHEEAPKVVYMIRGTGAVIR